MDDDNFNGFAGLIISNSLYLLLFPFYFLLYLFYFYYHFRIGQIVMNIKIGTSSYSYDDWLGSFYPETIKKSQMLEYYCQFFDTVELNVTYYTIPSARTFERLVAKTPDNFEFIIKTNNETTHRRKENESAVNTLLESVKPVIEAKKFHGFLAQIQGIAGGAKSGGLLKNRAAAHRGPVGDRGLNGPALLRADLTTVSSGQKYRSIARLQSRISPANRPPGLSLRSGAGVAAGGTDIIVRRKS